MPAPTPGDPPRRKSVLFCPGCGHESAVEGDWIVEERRGSVSYVCPNCGATVTTRSPDGVLLRC